MRTQIQGHAVGEVTKVASWFPEMPPAELEALLKAAMRIVEHGLSSMVGRAIGIIAPKLETVPISRLVTFIGNPEDETVGVYLLIRGDLKGQAILLMPMVNALDLVAMLMDQPRESVAFGELEQAALAEVGNLMVSYFLNAMAEHLDLSEPLYPSPPVVMVDMLGALLNFIATPVAAQSDHLLLVTCRLHAESARVVSTGMLTNASEGVQIHFWVVPDPLPHE